MASPATGQTYTLGGVVQEVIDKNLRLFPILFKQFKHINYAFFDVQTLAGEGGLSLKPKEINGIESALTVDGTSLKWLDYALFDFNTKIAANATVTLSSTSGTFTVGDTSGFAVNDRIVGVKSDDGTSDEFEGIVTSITNGTTMVVTVTRYNGSTTVNATQAIVVKAGQVIERAFWARNDNDEILRPSNLYNYTEYKSVIQHFSRRIEFTKAELNQEYRYEGDAKSLAAKKFGYQIAILIQELNKAIYKGINRMPGAGANDKMEMMGLEFICEQAGSIKDLSASTQPLLDFYNELEKSFRSGAIAGEEPMMMLCNDKHLTQLSRSNRDLVRYDKFVEVLNYTIPSISTIYGNVDIVRDPMLNKLYNYPVAFVLPRSLIKLWVRENQDYNPQGGINRADQSIRLYEVIHNLREKKMYDIEFEMGIIAGGLSATDCPFRMIKNFHV